MILNKYFYPDKQWLNAPHRVEPSGTYEIDEFTEQKIFTGEYEGDILAHFIQGNRKAGKTVGVGIFLIADFLLYGYQSVLLRRYISDFEKDKAMETFWMKSWPYRSEFPKVVAKHPGLQKLYPLELVRNFDWLNHEIVFKNNQAIVDGKIMCYPATLYGKGPTAFKEAGPFVDIHKIIYDEFIPEKDAPVIQGEVRKWAIIAETAARGRADALQTFGAIFISNAVTDDHQWAKEYDFKHTAKKDSHFFVKNPEKGFTLEKVENSAVSQEMEESALGTFLRGSTTGQAYLDYSQSNITQDDVTFVEKLTGDMRYLFNIKYEDSIYAMKFDLKTGLYYFTDEGVDKEFKNSYACTREDHSLDTVLITTTLRKRMLAIKLAYGSGQMRFADIMSKNVFMDIYTLL